MNILTFPTLSDLKHLLESNYFITSNRTVYMPIVLRTPVTVEEIRRLRVGDVVYITGTVITARDRAHMRIVDAIRRGEELPFEIDGSVIYHCGPLVVDGKVISAGPTTSARMNEYIGEIIDRVGSLAIVGKGGVNVEMKGKCVYLAYTGGCGALAAESVKAVKDVYWLDLGMPEAVWVFEVENFGPCIVAIDAHGNDIYRDVMERAERVFREIEGECQAPFSRQVRT